MITGTAFQANECYDIRALQALSETITTHYSPRKTEVLEPPTAVVYRLNYTDAQKPRTLMAKSIYIHLYSPKW